VATTTEAKNIKDMTYEEVKKQITDLLAQYSEELKCDLHCEVDIKRCTDFLSKKPYKGIKFEITLKN
jgi:hypothetical protein